MDLRTKMELAQHLVCVSTRIKTGHQLHQEAIKEHTLFDNELFLEQSLNSN